MAVASQGMNGNTPMGMIMQTAMAATPIGKVMHPGTGMEASPIGIAMQVGMGVAANSLKGHPKSIEPPV